MINVHKRFHGRRVQIMLGNLKLYLVNCELLLVAESLELSI